MREILFRGKRKDNGKWVEGSLLIYNDIVALDPYAEPTEYWIMSDGLEQVISETVGQYTGFDDKNGKKIFEGDVVNCTFCYDVGQYPRYETETRVVGFKISGFYPFTKSTHDPCEVIGNIHDNPELLEVE